MTAGSRPYPPGTAFEIVFEAHPMTSVAHDIIVKERIARGTQQVDAGGRSAFLEIAEGLGLGVAARDKIKIADLSLG